MERRRVARSMKQEAAAIEQREEAETRHGEFLLEEVRLLECVVVCIIEIILGYYIGPYKRMIISMHISTMPEQGTSGQPSSHLAIEP